MDNQTSIKGEWYLEVKKIPRCPQCHTANPEAQPACPSCGAEAPPTETQIVRESDLSFPQ